MNYFRKGTNEIQRLQLVSLLPETSQDTTVLEIVYEDRELTRVKKNKINKREKYKNIYATETAVLFIHQLSWKTSSGSN